MNDYDEFICAIKMGNVLNLRRLLTAEYIHKINENGESALDIAKNYNQQECLNILQSAGNEYERDIVNEVAFRDRFLTDFARGDFLRRVPLGNTFKYTDLKTKRIYSLVEVFAPKAYLAGEIATCSELRDHKNVVKCFGCIMEYNMIFLFGEFMEGGCLESYVYRNGPLDYQHTAHYCKQALQGLCFLHENGIIRKYVKYSNIFLDGRGNAKLDSASSYREEDSYTASYSTASDHTESGYGDLSFTKNLRSFGTTMAQMLTGKDYPSNIELDNVLAHVSIPQGFKECIHQAYATFPQYHEQVISLLHCKFLVNLPETLQ